MARLGPSARSRRRLGNAATGAVVEGLTIYGPHIVGAFLFALLLCAVSAFAHLVLGIRTPLAAAGGAISLTAGVAAETMRRRDRREDDDPE